MAKKKRTKKKKAPKKEGFEKVSAETSRDDLFGSSDTSDKTETK